MPEKGRDYTQEVGVGAKGQQSHPGSQKSHLGAADLPDTFATAIRSRCAMLWHTSSPLARNRWV